MTVGEVCNRNVVICRAFESVGTAARRMEACHVGDLVVVADRVDHREPVGIVTDRDLVIRVLARELANPYAIGIGDVCTSKLVTAREDESVADAVSKMRSFGIRRLIVVDDKGALQGIVTFDDLVEILAGELMDLAELTLKEQAHERELKSRATDPLVGLA
jgi:CBS domain-containing protein